jgi:hypothetical protein
MDSQNSGLLLEDCKIREKKHDTPEEPEEEFYQETIEKETASEEHDGNRGKKLEMAEELELNERNSTTEPYEKPGTPEQEELPETDGISEVYESEYICPHCGWYGGYRIDYFMHIHQLHANMDTNGLRYYICPLWFCEQNFTDLFVYSAKLFSMAALTLHGDHWANTVIVEHLKLVEGFCSW